MIQTIQTYPTRKQALADLRTIKAEIAEEAKGTGIVRRLQSAYYIRLDSEGKSHLEATGITIDEVLYWRDVLGIS